MENVLLDLDSGWDDVPGMRRVDVRHWGPELRYHGTRNGVEAFYREIEGSLGPFVLYGSGDFHYLAGVLLRRVKQSVTVVSFDNHPDWDIRPPHWACGGWVNRALEMPNVRRVTVWGCGNFELAFPARLFANRTALAAGTLEVHAWAERQNASVQRRFNCMTRDNWRERFEQFATSLNGQDVYVTVDLDCIEASAAVTNWENGLYTVDDMAWALELLRGHANVIAGDMCGAWSEPAYARRFQRFAGNWDHPKLPPIDAARALDVNRSTLSILWPALVGSDRLLDTAETAGLAGSGSDGKSGQYQK